MRAGAGSGWLSCGLLAALLVPVFAPVAAAAEKPLWELGAGLTVLQFPAYRGSDEDRLFVLPVPYVVYRGEFLKADRQGIRGTFFDSDRVELSLSLGASPPVSSDRVKAREGMPDLKPTVEIGPSLDVRLWRSADERLRLRTRLPLRAGFTAEGGPESTGWQFTPQLNLDWRDPAGLGGWTLGVIAGPVYGDRRQHRYFYEVEANEAMPLRPAYDARGGYGGTQVLAALWKRYPGWWVGGFVRYDTLAGAVFDDSPLVKRKDYFAAGFALTWVLGESSRRVEADE
ncbi:MipA/OmpV family protein [Aromatoleum petrolei]|uniref:MipA/OmpV family protein n=1 Tax=Aromatoleum petrolei TaxID=76116 RepID=A0ABX1MJW8_9RHOO|nr:MipA/OmpV family protein [Aromatoleum petrolei]NMF88023.1 MipA/OmpV family protein [Aromatoleum petrolei]